MTVFLAWSKFLDIFVVDFEINILFQIEDLQVFINNILLSVNEIDVILAQNFIYVQIFINDLNQLSSQILVHEYYQSKNMKKLTIFIYFPLTIQHRIISFHQRLLFLFLLFFILLILLLTLVLIIHHIILIWYIVYGGPFNIFIDLIRYK